MDNPRKPKLRTVYNRLVKGINNQSQNEIKIVLPENTAKASVKAAPVMIEQERGPVIYRVLKSAEVGAASAFVRGAFIMFVAPLLKPAGRAEFYKYIKPEAFRRRMSDNYTYVALCGDEIIGLINARDYNHVSLLFVALHMQRQGIGKQLLGYVERRARKNGYNMLTVHASPNSLKVYERMGFVRKSDELTEKNIRYYQMQKELAGVNDDSDIREL